MTVKELSQFCGCTERNIQHWVKKACNDTANEQLAKNLQKTVSSAGHGKSATFNIDEVELILKNSTLPPLVVSALIQNERGDNTSNSVAQNNDCLTRAFENMTRAFEYISKTQAMQEERLSKLEHHFEERKALLPAPGIKPRDHINMLARSYAKPLRHLSKKLMVSFIDSLLTELTAIQEYVHRIEEWQSLITLKQKDRLRFLNQ